TGRPSARRRSRSRSTAMEATTPGPGAERSAAKAKASSPAPRLRRSSLMIFSKPATEARRTGRGSARQSSSRRGVPLSSTKARRSAVPAGMRSASGVGGASSAGGASGAAGAAGSPRPQAVRPSMRAAARTGRRMGVSSELAAQGPEFGEAAALQGLGEVGDAGGAAGARAAADDALDGDHVLVPPGEQGVV